MEDFVDDPADRDVDVDLWRAAKRGDMELLRSALAAGGDPNAENLQPAWDDDVGGPALCVAVAGGHLEVVRALLEAGAVPNPECNTTAHTPLMRAFVTSVPVVLYQSCLDFVGLDDARDAVERRLLPIVVALIESGANVDASSAGCKTLGCAVEHGRRRTLLTLLRAGAKFETTKRFELTFTGEEFPPPFSSYINRSGDIYRCCFQFQGERFKGEIVSIDGKPTAEFSRDRLDACLADRQSAAQAAGGPQPYRVGFFHQVLHFSSERNPDGSNEFTLALMEAIQNAGSFDEYARRLQRDVHAAILTKCSQEKLPLDITTIITTYLWKWGGA